MKKGSSRKEWILQHGQDDDALSQPSSSSIGALALGGSKNDKIFITRRTNIEGISRKGKPFFEMKTNVTDSLSEIHVKDSRVFTAGNHTYTVFEDERDVAHMLLSSQINTMALVELNQKKVGFAYFLRL